ncbi:MAG: DUF1343 domain-containing protein [Candidatus Sericytochromatia bacterium]
MKKIKLILSALSTFIIVSNLTQVNVVEAKGRVLTGLDVLSKNNYDLLKNKKIGLITNHTALDRKGHHILDLFAKQDKIDYFKLKAIFTPEHGLRGKEDKEFIPSEVYGENIPVYSLYGDVRKPTQQMLNGLDVLIYDIQDIGTRYYTYTTTMAYCMEAAAEKGIPFIVLDRPDPITGTIIEGEVLNYKFRSFTGYFSIPTRYAMTIGELANYYKGEYGINSNLKVVKMENWERDMWYDQTGLKWVNPSPNMRSLEAATLYPGLGMLETINISVGRGTKTPFMLYGAPWINSYSVLEEFEQNDIKFSGLKFNATKFIPNDSVYANQRIDGFKIDINDRNKVRSFDAMVYFINTLKKLYPNDIEYNGMKRSFGSSILTDMMDGKYKPEEVLDIVNENQKNFMSIRQKYLLY